MHSWPTINSRKHSELIAVVNTRDKPSLVRITELHLVDRDGTFLCRRAFRTFENKTGAVTNGDGFNISSHWIFDRLQSDSKIIAEPCGAFETVDVHIKWNELRVEQCAEGCRQNFERQSTCLTRPDLEQGFPLFFGRFFIAK